MIQFNLLPDIKQEFIKARRSKRMMLLVSFGVSALSIFVLLLMVVTVDVVQKARLSGLNDKIGKYAKQIKKTPDLSKILTVQNQLSTLTDLHNQKVVTSRLFTYISQVTPQQASISKLDVDYTANTMSITGEAPTLDVINAFADTLKATKYNTDADTKTMLPAFNQVVLAAFGRDSKGATYTITLNFDPIIFNSTNNVTLTVPPGATGAQAQFFQKEAS